MDEHAAVADAQAPAARRAFDYRICQGQDLYIFLPGYLARKTEGPESGHERDSRRQTSQLYQEIRMFIRQRVGEVTGVFSGLLQKSSSGAKQG